MFLVISGSTFVWWQRLLRRAQGGAASKLLAKWHDQHGFAISCRLNDHAAVVPPWGKFSPSPRRREPLLTTLRGTLACFSYYLLHFGVPWPVFVTVYYLLLPGPFLLLFAALWRPLAHFCYCLLHLGAPWPAFATMYYPLGTPHQKKGNFAQRKGELFIEAKKGTFHQPKKGNHSAWPGLLLGLTCCHDLIGSPGQLCSAVVFEPILEKGVKVSKRRARNSMSTHIG